MPTGYTSIIKDGVTFEQFALGCARAFGACVTMRDEPQSKPIPEVFAPSGWHLEQLEKARAELARLNNLTLGEAAECAKEDYETRKQQITTAIEEEDKLMEQYRAMLAQVKAWEPPTPDHIELKDFMIKQINGSLEFDAMGDYYGEHPAVLLCASDWLELKEAEAMKDIEYHTKQNEAEIDRTNNRNEWLKALRGSLV